MEMKVRGQVVVVDGRTIKFRIDHPVGDTFSISDKLHEMLKNGFTLEIDLAGKSTATLSPTTKYYRKEEVKSKFPGAQPWFRYWFKKPQEQQMEMS